MTGPEDLIKKNVLESMQAQVENLIRSKIRSGEWGVGAKIPSEREMAEILDVSRTTVRNAVQALTQQGLFERKIGQGTFVRGGERPPAGLPAAGLGTLGFVVCKDRAQRKPLASESFYFDVFTGIEEETVRSGRHLLFTYLDEANPAERAAFASFLDKVDGVVLEECRRPDLLQELADRRLPVVLLAPTLGHPKFDLVTADFRRGARRAVEHLLALGHRRVAVINGPLDQESARLRFGGWQDALQASDLDDPDRLVAGNLGWSAEAGARAMEGLLDQHPVPTAVFCANDLLAVGAVSALGRRGLRVPDDVSVVGFDDAELSRHTVPPLTTMRLHAQPMARAAVRKLIERLEFPESPPVTVEFPIDLVDRESCARGES